MKRRSSGEVINATLMEVFLFLSFLVLVLLHSATVAKNEADRRAMESEGVAAELRASVASSDEQLRATEQERDAYKTKYLSNHPPDCNLSGIPKTVLSVCIGVGNKLHVRMLSGVGSHAQGETGVYTTRGFRQAFDDVWKVGQEHQCRFHAVVSREDLVETGEYIEANRAVAQLFYSDWSSRPCKNTQID